VVPVCDTGHLIGGLAVTIFVGGAVASQRDEDVRDRCRQGMLTRIVA
jgi:hypothetical protein